MKKTLSVILVAVMLLSTLVALVVPAAAEGEGDWEVYLTATSVEVDPADQAKVPPLPGYYYDDTGFHSKSPDYTNYNPKFTVISKEQYNIENFTMTVVIHDYVISGDNWLSFSIWSESNGIDQGGVSGKYGDGWTSLIRGEPSANTLNRMESWNATKGGRSGKQVFTAIDNTQLAPVVFEEVLNDDGDRVITFAIEDGVVKVNGVTLGAGTDNCIKDRFKEGLAYVGVTLHNTVNTGAYSPTISVIDVNGEVPAGSDSREPENKQRVIAPPADPNTVPVGQPALWFDASLEATNKTMPQHTGCELTYAADNKSFLVNLEQDSFQIHFAPPDDISYNAEDFPYFAIVYKNFCTCALPEGESAFGNCDLTGTTQQTTVWYFAGEHTSANQTGIMQVANYFCINPLNEDGSSAVNDFYTVAVFQIINPENWVGRINGFRLDVNALTNYAVEGHNSIEILGTGFFRAPSEISTYLGNMKVEDKNFNVESIKEAFWDCLVDGHIGDADEDGYCDLCWEPVCTHVDENGDGVCDNCEVEIGTSGGEDTTDATTEETTEAPSENATTEKVTDATNNDSDSDDKGGCGSVVSMGALAIVAIVGTGLVIKKKED